MEDAQEHIRRAMFEREELPCGQLQIIEPSFETTLNNFGNVGDGYIWILVDDGRLW